MWQLRVIASPRPKGMCTHSQALLCCSPVGPQKKDWGQGRRLGTVQLYNNPLLLVHRNKAPLTSRDPSLHPRDCLRMLNKGLKACSDPWFCMDMKQMSSITEGRQEILCHQHPTSPHHHQGPRQSLAVIVRRRAGAPNKAHPQSPRAQDLPQTQSGSGEPRIPTTSPAPVTRTRCLRLEPVRSTQCGAELRGWWKAESRSTALRTHTKHEVTTAHCWTHLRPWCAKGHHYSHKTPSPDQRDWTTPHTDGLTAETCLFLHTCIF